MLLVLLVSEKRLMRMKFAFNLKKDTHRNRNETKSLQEKKRTKQKKFLEAWGCDEKKIFRGGRERER